MWFVIEFGVQKARVYKKVKQVLNILHENNGNMVEKVNQNLASMKNWCFC